MTDVIPGFAERLFRAVPDLRSDWEDYAQSQQEGLEPPRFGVFLLKLVRSCGEWLRSNDPAAAARLDALFQFLESELGADPEIDELIETGFATYLPEPGDPTERMLDLLGPKLRAARTRQLLQDNAAVPESTVAFLRRLAEAVPVLRGRAAAHFDRLLGRPLPHVFVGEIVFEAVELAASGRGEVVRPLLDFLEAEYGVDADVDNVIEASFLEMLPDPGERGREIMEMLGPDLRAAYSRMNPPAGHRQGYR